MKSTKSIKNVLFIALALIIATTFGMNTATAESRHGKILSVKKTIEQVSEPEEVCNVVQNQPSQYAGTTRVIGSIAGGAIGGFLGNRVGSGNGRFVTTSIGTMIGGLVGDQTADAFNRANQGSKQECQTVERKRSRTVYIVAYDVDGQTHITKTLTNPGRKGDPIRHGDDWDD